MSLFFQLRFTSRNSSYSWTRTRISLTWYNFVCGDSHTSTHGAFGSLAFGIGTSEVEHVLSTQTLPLKPAKNYLIDFVGKLEKGITAKDVILNLIGQIGTAGGTGFVFEYAGEVIDNFSMEERMTICNMSIEAGARAGLIAPDNKTFEYLKNKPLSPKKNEWDKAVEYWETLKSDRNAFYDKTIKIDASAIEPQVTWGQALKMWFPYPQAYLILQK